MAEGKDVGGRPTSYSKELGDVICSHLADGLSLRQICAKDGMPAVGTVCRWVAEDREGFQEQYAQARAIQAETLADEIIDISDDGSNDWMERKTAEGENVAWTVNGECIQRSKLRVDARKWVASKLLPKKYGDKITQEHTGKDGGPVQVVIGDKDSSVL